jgi:hypothetical protein
MNTTPRRLAALTIVLCLPLIVLGLPPGEDDELTGEVPLVDSQEDYERMSALMPRAVEAVMDYVTQSTQSIQQGYEMGFGEFRQWCRDNEQALQSQTDDSVLQRLLEAGLSVRPSGVAGRASAFMQGLERLLGSASGSGGSPAAGLDRFLRAHEQAVERALSGLAVYPEQFRNAHADLIEAARQQVLVEQQSRQAGSDQAIVLGPASTTVLRQAGVPVPGSATIHAFAQAVLAEQLRVLGRDEGITIGSDQDREVPAHLDSELAAMESAFHGNVANQETCFLLTYARSRNRYLMHPPSPMGPCYRAALARSLILIYNELDERLDSARRPGAAPRIECMEWAEDDPLRGNLTAISPFSMHDPWSAIEAESSRQCPTRPATTTPRPRPPTPPADPLRPEFAWSVERANRAASPFDRSAEVGDYIALRIVSPPADQITNHQWTMVSAPDGRTYPIESGRMAGRTSFQVRAEGTYVVELTVETSRGRLRPSRQEINTARVPPPPGQDPAPSWEDPETDQLLRDLVAQTEPGTFARWFLENYTTCMRSNPVRVGEAADTWRRPGQTGVPRQWTFHRPTSVDVRQLRQWHDRETRITPGNESEIEYFRSNRQGLQRTIDYWETARSRSQGEHHLNYRASEEYPNFSLIMSMNPPVVRIPAGGVP